MLGTRRLAQTRLRRMSAIIAILVFVCGLQAVGAGVHAAGPPGDCDGDWVPIKSTDGFIIDWTCVPRGGGGGGGDGKPPDKQDQAEGDALIEICNQAAAIGEILPECQNAAQGPALNAWAKFKPPKPDVRTAPPLGTDAAVGLPTWVWIAAVQWKPQTVTDTDNGAAVTITATPERIVLEPGEGLPKVECDGPATPYDPGVDAAAQKPSCSYTYRRSSAGLDGSAYQVKVSVLWSGTWTAPGASGTFPGTVAAVTELDLRVAEGQALN